MTRPTPISGFPEWLPPQRMIEQHVVDRLRSAFELYGFAPLETRAVEPLDQLLRKGETSKEVYLLRRLQAEPPGAGDASGRGDGRGRAVGAGDASGRGDGRGEQTLGLHFDLTVPFARYVLENAGKLQFPFKRYQIQKVWRGERPQEGRYREFLQADIDVVGRGELPAHFEAELALTAGEALRSLPIPPVLFRANNRKLCEGFYRGLGLADPAAVLAAVDKLDKIGPARVGELLAATAGASETQTKACLAMAEISAGDDSFVAAVRALGVEHPLLDEGIDELVRVVDTAREHAPGLLVADLKIARGLDYYTGTVYEAELTGFERHGAVCAGGRYDNLASAGADRYPGVGISIGVSRILGLLFGADALGVSRSVPTCVLVALPTEPDRAVCDRIAAALRRRGIATEVSPDAPKYGKQIRAAQRRGIPYVWFPGVGGAPDEVKDIRSGEQVVADPATWNPPPEDLHPLITDNRRHEETQ